MEMTATPPYHINLTDESRKNGSFYVAHFEMYAELKKSLQHMCLVVFCLAFVLGVVGNGVVIWVTGFKMKKTVHTVWFLNLAVADFLFTASLPLTVTYTAMDFHWPFGKFMCKLAGFLTFVNIFTSVYILMVISVDRCVSVVWPVWAQNHRSVRRASCVSLGVWLLALILSTPYFIFRDTGPAYYRPEIVNCYLNFASSKSNTSSVDQLREFRYQAMVITRFLLGFIVPFTVIVSCYAVIIHRIRRNRTLASQSSRPFKIIAAVITTFFLCWAPYHIMTFIEMVNNKIGYRNLTIGIATAFGTPIATSLAFLNSCLNPLLYVFMGQDFKDKVCKSFLKALMTAFQEEVSHARTDSRSADTRLFNLSPHETEL